MSSTRSRSGGMVTIEAAIRWYRSARKLPAATSPLRSRLVAQMSLNLLCSHLSPPTRL